jgi:hypothetical protein
MLSLPYISDTTAHKMVSSNIVDTTTVPSVLLQLQSKVSFVAEDYQLTNVVFIWKQEEWIISASTSDILPSAFVNNFLKNKTNES